MKTLKEKNADLKANSELDNDILDNVNGGYLENSGFSAGVYIKCPNCNETRQNMFNTYADMGLGADSYHCRNCGFNFRVYGSGRAEWD